MDINRKTQNRFLVGLTITLFYLFIFMYYIISIQIRTIPKHTDYRSAFDTNFTGPAFWQALRPSFECPSTHLTKVGKDGDGYKWTCGLVTLTELSPCIIYSFGVNHDSSFEAEILATTKECQVYAFDPTVDSIGHPLHPYNKRAQFFKIGIGASDIGNFRRLYTLMKENDHGFIHILKVDVEGAEFRSFAQMLDDFADFEVLPIGQLLVEFHLFTHTFRNNRTDFLKILEGLELKGLRLFHLEMNRSGHGCCAELSFLNTEYTDFFLRNK